MVLVFRHFDVNICAVKFKDNTWYRAIVLSNNVENHVVTVRYLDFASIEEVSTHLCQIPWFCFINTFYYQILICS